MRTEIVRAELVHCQVIADNIREPDRDELWAIGYLSPFNALMRSWAVSDKSWTALFDGMPACMFGVSMGSAITDTGRPWLIGSRLIDRYPLSFLKGCKPHMDEVRKQYMYLENYVDVRNIRAIKWLKWMGFSVSDRPEPYGVMQLPFYYFGMGGAI